MIRRPSGISFPLLVDRIHRGGGRWKSAALCTYSNKTRVQFSTQNRMKPRVIRLETKLNKRRSKLFARPIANTMCTKLFTNGCLPDVPAIAQVTRLDTYNDQKKLSTSYHTSMTRVMTNRIFITSCDLPLKSVRWSLPKSNLREPITRLGHYSNVVRIALSVPDNSGVIDTPISHTKVAQQARLVCTLTNRT